MRFRKFTFSWLSFMIGFHYGHNPVSGTRFLHIAPIPFFGIDFYWPEEHPSESPRQSKMYSEPAYSDHGDEIRQKMGLPPDGSSC